MITLGAKLTDTVFVFGLQGHIQTSIAPNVIAFVIQGVYESGMSEYDDIYLFAGIPSVQQLINFDDAVTGFEVMVTDVEMSPKIKGIGSFCNSIHVNKFRYN